MLFYYLYSETSLYVKLKIEGSVSDPLPVQRDVHQGCVLAPHQLILNWFCARLANHKHPCTTLGNWLVPALLHTDILVLLYRSQVGIKCAVKILITHCSNELLQINEDKSQNMVFRKSARRSNKRWKIGAYKLQLVNEFKYLEIVFQSKLLWSEHIQNLKCKTDLVLWDLKDSFTFKENIKQRCDTMDAPQLPDLVPAPSRTTWQTQTFYFIK